MSELEGRLRCICGNHDWSCRDGYACTGHPGLAHICLRCGKNQHRRTEPAMIHTWLRHTAVVWLPLAAFILILAVPGSVWGRM